MDYPSRSPFRPDEVEDRLMGWSNRTRIYWAAFGIDQLLHQLTYLAIVVVLVPRAAAQPSFIPGPG
jgi:hypothetical protein